MEAATPLRKSQVRTVGDSLAIEDLIVEDEAAVRLVREREQAGEDPVSTVVDAIEIGARVLDREQTGANAEFVRTEFGKASREAEEQFAERAREITDELTESLEQVFGPESGVLAKAFETHFSDGSSDAVQNRVKAIVTELMANARSDLLKQFSSADGENPLADFKQQSVAAIRDAAKRQQESLDRVGERMAGLEVKVEGLQKENEKLEELEEERERGTAKGRSYEELVTEVVEQIAADQGDDAEGVGDQKGPAGKRGDVLSAIEGCRGPALGRIVLEAKNSKLTRPKAIAELDEALEQRDAQYALLVVPDEDKAPAKTETLREFGGGNKMVVVYDPEEDNRLALELAYKLARARVLMARSDAEGVDAGAIGETTERALSTMDEVRKIKQHLTGAKSSIDKGDELLEAMAQRVRVHLREIEDLLRPAGEDADAGQLDLE
ncbi:MAG: hypothetical protein H0V85_07570 [Thermoleophilaceae bacterium]|nr:hypothetical protein [Thermoleophilaceae bacterium]